MSKIFRGVLLGACLAALISACDNASEPNASEGSDDTRAVADTQRSYVGSDACRDCHTRQFDQWRDSHHFKAMAVADSDTVAGNFAAASFDYFGTVSEFFSADSQYFVRTDDEHGETAQFEITHTFGVAPLQQYLVTFADGRRQPLAVAADTRAGSGDAAPWFHLYPDEQVTADDWRHWTGSAQNWNYMCADCHSTDLRRNYDFASRTYDTTWAEISVGCEACHGPASAHVSWATSVDKRDGRMGLTAQLGNPREQIDTCARCHSRRGIIAEEFEPGGRFMDHYRPALLDEGLYHADGQIEDEVYVHGSFLQSKMYRRGVVCSDCHQSHDAGRDVAANATCTRCHQSEPPAQFPTLSAREYDDPEHHFHRANSDGSQCVACHMPSKLYMVIDERHDHSLRIPRPDLSVTLGVPNACGACHEERGAEWAAEQIAARYPAPRPPHYATAIAAGRRGLAGAAAALSDLAGDDAQAGIVRGTALSLLGAYQTAGARSALVAGTKDSDPLVRLGALRGMAGVPPDRRWLLAAALLDDPLLAVRMEAVSLLAPARTESPAARSRLASAIAEYLAVQSINADRPETHSSTGYVLSASGDAVGGRRAYGKALALEPGFVPALINLADLNRVAGRDDASGDLFEQALASEADNADVRQAYGMWLTRQGRAEDALPQFAAAASFAPDESRFAYIHGIALNSTGRSAAALEILGSAHERFPQDADILFALATMHRDRADIREALAYAQRLLAIRPGEPAVQGLVKELQGQLNSGQ